MDTVTNQMGKLVIAPPTITINYEPGKNWDSPNIWMLYELIVNRKLPVLLVGEGNFSFALALAVARGSWHGITATCLNDLPFQHPTAANCVQFEDPTATYVNFWTSLKNLSVGHCITNSMILDEENSSGLGTLLRRISYILRVEIPPQHCLKGGVDCRALPDELAAPIVWFQCPWTPDRRDLGGLLATFLMNSRSDYVLIGIANHFPYTISYELGSLFQNLEQFGQVPIECGNYKYLGADDHFIQEILRFGYKHEGCLQDKDIHTTIIKDHITLVFQRKDIKVL